MFDLLRFQASGIRPNDFMVRVSFRQSMLAGFLLIVVFLGWAGVRAWVLLERFAAQSRANGEIALQLSATIQELGERSVELERSARQFMVLNDRTVLARFDAQVFRSLTAIERLDSFARRPLEGLPGAWQRTVGDLSRSLHQSASSNELPALLSRLAEINAQLDHASRRWIDTQHAATLQQLEEGRLQLGALVAGAVGAAFLVALAMSLWLSRPIGAIERAIGQLGESRFDDPVEISGPADLRLIGRRLDWLRQRLSELEEERERADPVRR